MAVRNIKDEKKISIVIVVNLYSSNLERLKDVLAGACSTAIFFLLFLNVFGLFIVRLSPTRGIKRFFFEKLTEAIVIESKLRDINIQLMSKCFLMRRDLSDGFIFVYL